MCVFMMLLLLLWASAFFTLSRIAGLISAVLGCCLHGMVLERDGQAIDGVCV